MKIFLSFSFNHGLELTKATERLLSSHDVVPITGRQLGGEQVDTAVEGKILQADALISLITRKPNAAAGEMPTSQAVLQEYYFARTRGMRAIAVVENGLQFADMSNKERVAYDPQLPLEGILRISETIAEWRRDMGQELKVQILPSALADELENDELLKCSHRLVEKELGTPWKDVTAISEEEGVFVYLRGVRSGHRIQLRIMDAKQRITWQSSAKLPWASLQLKDRQNGK